MTTMNENQPLFSDSEENAPLEIADDEVNSGREVISRETQLHRLENIAVPACYLIVGIMQGLNRPLLNVYPLDLGATEAQQVTVSTLVTLPSTFKIFFGFLSDNFPIFGYRRQCYMALGWVLASITMFTLVFTCNLQISHNEQETIVPEDAPSISWLSLMFVLFGTGMWLADVMGDSIVAEKSRLERGDQKGQLQSTCYACRFFGLMVAAPCSTAMYSFWGPLGIVLCMAIIPLAMLPLIYYFEELKDAKVQSISEHCEEIWSAVCSRSVWQPMGFAFVFNLLQVPNVAWKQFLKTVYGFSSAQLNALLVATYVLLYVGIMTYKYCFLHVSWRLVFVVSIAINTVASAMQLLLIKGQTFGLSPFLFALGDDAAHDFILGIEFLPISMMMVALCPPGSEGASYAMFTTVWNSALMLAPSIGTLLLRIWDVSKESMEQGYLEGLWNLSILTTIIQSSAILFVKWMPHSRTELQHMNQRSKAGGILFLSVVACSVFYTLVVGILNIVRPGWAGES